MRNRVYVRLPVCSIIRPPHAAAVGLLLCARRVGAQQQRRRSTALSSKCEQCVTLIDHYAILSHFTLTCTQTAIPDPQSDCSTRLDWKGADIDHYQLLLSNLLSDISLPVDALLCQDTLCNSHSDSLKWYYNKIIDCLLSASRQSVPVVKTGVQKHW